MAFERGPYLQAAVFCERVLHEKDGLLSIIRIIDRVIHGTIGAGAPETLQPFTYPLTAVIMLKAGDARGTCQVRLDWEEPSGLVTKGPSVSALMEGEDRGQNLILNLQMNFKEAGLYWFRLYVDDTLLTQLPFRVVYTRTS